jgi:hypothetical protein
MLMAGFHREDDKEACVSRVKEFLRATKHIPLA